MEWGFLLISIAFAVVAQYLLKAASGGDSLIIQLLDLRTIAGLALYGISAVLYITALRRIPLSIALPCTALSYFMVAAIGHYAFGEAINAQKIAALLLIGIGVALLTTA